MKTTVGGVNQLTHFYEKQQTHTIRHSFTTTRAYVQRCHLQRKEQIMTQQERIIKYMNDFGSITALEAVSDLGITQLSARICELQNKGYEFNKDLQTGKNRYGEPTHFIRYSLGGKS